MIAKLKSIEKGQRLQYFKDYYLLKCIAIIAFMFLEKGSKSLKFWPRSKPPKIIIVGSVKEASAI